MPGLEERYPRAMHVLRETLGDENLKAISPYLHVFDGTAASVKPVAKHVTIYWLGRTAAEAVLRTEGEDDIILTRFLRGDRVLSVPTLIFRKQKAVLLRSYMETVRRLYVKYLGDLKSTVFKEYSGLYGEGYDFLSCGISPGIEEGRGGTGEMRCMKCPVDVLMGAVSGKGVEYNLASRVMGDPAYATEERYRPRTGNAVDEVTYRTIMSSKTVEGAETGALYTERIVEPGTIFVGKTVVFMPSPVELVYLLYLLTRVNRFGARKTIMGVMELHPVALVAGMFEAGTAYSATEQMLGVNSLDKAREKLLDYARSVADQDDAVIDLAGLENRIRSVNVDDRDLYIELWRNATNYVMGVKEYVARRAGGRRR